MGSGDPPGLQNRREAGFPVFGQFDSDTLPPQWAASSKLQASGSHQSSVVRKTAALHFAPHDKNALMQT